VTTQEKQLLEDLLNNPVFHSILAQFAANHRQDVVPRMVTAFNLKNVEVAALATGALDIVENLPSMLKEFLSSQLQESKSQ
jgi:hypothetical protein